MKYSVVIPTLSRPEDLIKAVRSLTQQEPLPSQLIIVDQSPATTAKTEVVEICANYPSINLFYLHEQSIKSLPVAKQYSLSWVTGDIVCFFDDDVELEPDFMKWKFDVFSKHPHIVGCCGIEMNPQSRSKFFLWIFHFFHQGIFQDRRIGLPQRYPDAMPTLIPSDKISGGFSSWRNEVFSHVSFDVKNGLHLTEDVDFSSRVSKVYGGERALAICTKSRLWHNCSPRGRLNLALKQQRKIREFVIYYRLRRHWPTATVSFLWLMFGLFIETCFLMLRHRSLATFWRFWSGLVAGFKHPIQSSAKH